MTSRSPAAILQERAELASRMSRLDRELAEVIGVSGAANDLEPKHVTVEAFCKAAGISRTALYLLIPKGLPAPLVPNVGRRVLLEEGRAWLRAYGLRQAKEKRGGKRA